MTLHSWFVILSGAKDPYDEAFEIVESQGFFAPRACPELCPELAEGLSKDFSE
jgi:hypothetical protein